MAPKHWMEPARQLLPVPLWVAGDPRGHWWGCPGARSLFLIAQQAGLGKPPFSLHTSALGASGPRGFIGAFSCGSLTVKEEAGPCLEQLETSGEAGGPSWQQADSPRAADGRAGVSLTHLAWLDPTGILCKGSLLFS